MRTPPRHAAMATTTALKIGVGRLTEIDAKE